MLDSSYGKAEMRYEMYVPTVFEAKINFRERVTISRKAVKKMLKIYQIAVNSFLAVSTVLLGEKDFDALTNSSSAELPQGVIEPYM